jgi:hypothetical protein
MSSGYKTEKRAETQEKLGFFKRLFSAAGAERRRAIRRLKRELASAKVDLYKLKHDTISPGVAKLLFEIYKLTYPIKQFLPYDRQTNRFQPSFEESFVASFQEDETKAINEKFDEEFINKLVGKYGVKKATSYVEKLLGEYFDKFSSDTVKEINGVYTNFLSFARFANYGFYPLLREFDPKLEEANFTKKPAFLPAEGSFLRKDLLKLHRVIHAFSVDEGLDRAMEVFGRIKGMDPISKSNFARLKNLVASFQSNDYVALIVRAIDKSLAPIPVEAQPVISVFDSFAYKKKGTVQAVLASIKSRMKEDSISTLLSQLFGGEIREQVKNYTEARNDQFKSNGLPVFAYVKPLEYVKAFVTEKYKGSINRVVNELIIGGIFINKAVLTELSNSYYALNGHLGSIAEFDGDLDQDGNTGRSVKRLLYTIKKDKNAKSSLEKLINDVNRKAKRIIDEKVVNVREMAYCIKAVLEDYKQKNPAVVANIKKIRMNYNKQFIQELVSAYKDIYLFLKLLSNYVSIKVTRAETGKDESPVAEEEVT